MSQFKVNVTARSFSTGVVHILIIIRAACVQFPLSNIMYEPVKSLLTFDSHCFNNGKVGQTTMYMYGFVVWNPLKSDDMSSTSTRCHSGGSCKALFVCALQLSVNRRHTMYVHADEGQPARNRFALHKPCEGFRVCKCWL